MKEPRCAPLPDSGEQGDPLLLGMVYGASGGDAEPDGITGRRRSRTALSGQ